MLLPPPKPPKPPPRPPLPRPAGAAPGFSTATQAFGTGGALPPPPDDAVAGAGEKITNLPAAASGEISEAVSPSEPPHTTSAVAIAFGARGVGIGTKSVLNFSVAPSTVIVDLSVKCR